MRTSSARLQRKHGRFGPSLGLTTSSMMSRCLPSRTGESFTTNARAMKSSRRRRRSENRPLPFKSHEWGITNGAAAWVLSLDRKWQPCLIHNGGRFLSIKDRKIEGGMSGSPIIDANGAAIGLISTGSGGGDYYGVSQNACLMDCLPP